MNAVWRRRLSAATNPFLTLVTVMVLSSVAVAAPPGHPVRIGVLDLIVPSFDPATNPVAQ